MTLSRIPEGMRLTSTSQYLSLNLFLLATKLMALVNCLIGFAAIFLGAPQFGFFLACCGLIVMFADRRQKQRRYLAASIYRTPRSICLSEHCLFMDWRLLRIANVAFVAVLILVLLEIESTLVRVILFFVVGALAWPAPAAVLSLIKYYFDQNFRIVIFRRNRSEIAEAHKSVIMPACGCYGQVLLIVDESLSSFREPMPERMATWWLSEMYHPMVVTDDPDHWRHVVMIELALADFAVLDWSGEVTENMRWELHQTLLMLPPDRILLVGATAEELERSAPPGIVNVPHALQTAVAPERGMPKALFLLRLSRAMARLREGPRAAQALARAAHFRERVFLDLMDWKAIEAGALRVPT